MAPHYRVELLAEAQKLLGRQNRKVIPIFEKKPRVGDFLYDIRAEKATVSDTLKQIWDFPSKVINIGQIIDRVFYKHRTQFLEVAIDSVGKVDHVTTLAFTLDNGSKVYEHYRYIYHSEDYERKSPLFIEGKTFEMPKAVNS